MAPQVTIGMIDNSQSTWRSACEDELRQQLHDLGFDSSYAAFQSIADAPAAAGCPAVVYFHNAAQAAPLPWLRDVVDADRCLPVVEQLASSAQLPAPVNECNAIEYRSRGAAGVVRELLAMLLLRRRAKRVFLSYRRAEATSQAARLHDLLTKDRYDVFLDTATIHAAAQFQRALKDWLIDCDVVLSLATPQLADSSWVLEELQTARTHGVGLLVVRWPQFDPQRRGKAGFIPNIFDSVDADQVIQLTDQDFAPVDGQSPADWTESVYERVMARLEEIRNRLVLARTRDLMGLLRDDPPAQLDVATIDDSFGDLRVSDQHARVVALVRAFPFRPTVEALMAFADQHKAMLAPRLHALFHGGSQQSTAALRWLLDAERKTAPKTIGLIRSADELKGCVP